MRQHTTASQFLATSPKMSRWCFNATAKLWPSTTMPKWQSFLSLIRFLIKDFVIIFQCANKIIVNACYSSSSKVSSVFSGSLIIRSSMPRLKCPHEWAMFTAVSNLSPVNTHTCDSKLKCERRETTYLLLK